MGAEGPRMPSPPKELTRTQFGRVASKYRCSADHTDVEDLDLLFAGLALEPAHRVLDVATGGGGTGPAAPLPRRWARVAGDAPVAPPRRADRHHRQRRSLRAVPRRLPERDRKSARPVARAQLPRGGVARVPRPRRACPPAERFSLEDPRLPGMGGADRPPQGGAMGDRNDVPLLLPPGEGDVPRLYRRGPGG